MKYKLLMLCYINHIICMFSERKWTIMTAAPWHLKYSDYNCSTQITGLLQNILKWSIVLPIMRSVCCIMGLYSNDTNILLHPLGSPLPAIICVNMAHIHGNWCVYSYHWCFLFSNYIWNYYITVFLILIIS